MGKPAARITDMHTCPMVTPGTPPIPHVGGPVIGPGVPTVLIGGMPAAVVGDMCVCIGPPDTIAMGSTGVFIGGKPAARMGDSTAHGGVIVGGLPTVLIGETETVEIASSPCIDATVPGQTHVQKMASAIKQSNMVGEVISELGGPIGIATGIAAAVGGGILAAFILPEVLGTAAVVAETAEITGAVGEVALAGESTLAGTAATGAASETLTAEISAGDKILRIMGEVKEIIDQGKILVKSFQAGEEIGDGLAHLADFYVQTKYASTCQDLKEAGKSFKDGIEKISAGTKDAILAVGGAAKMKNDKLIEKKLGKEGAEKHEFSNLTLEQLDSETEALEKKE